MFDEKSRYCSLLSDLIEAQGYLEYNSNIDTYYVPLMHLPNPLLVIGSLLDCLNNEHFTFKQTMS